MLLGGIETDDARASIRYAESRSRRWSSGRQRNPLNHTNQITCLNSADCRKQAPHPCWLTFSGTRHISDYEKKKQVQYFLLMRRRSESSDLIFSVTSENDECFGACLGLPWWTWDAALRCCFEPSFASAAATTKEFRLNSVLPAQPLFNPVQNASLVSTPRQRARHAEATPGSQRAWRCPLS